MNAYYVARGWQKDLTPYDPAQWVLRENLNLLYDISSIHFFFPLSPYWMEDLLKYSQFPQNRKFFSLYNVKYIVDPYNQFKGELPLLESYDGGLRLQIPLDIPHPESPFTIRFHTNPAAFPRAFLVPKARILEGDADNTTKYSKRASQIILNPDFNPKNEVLIHLPENEIPPPLMNGTSSMGKSLLECTQYTPTKVSFRVQNDTDCWFFISDTHYPGWKAVVYGDTVPIYRANIAGRAIRIKKGSQTAILIMIMIMIMIKSEK